MSMLTRKRPAAPDVHASLSVEVCDLLRLGQHYTGNDASHLVAELQAAGLSVAVAEERLFEGLPPLRLEWKVRTAFDRQVKRLVVDAHAEAQAARIAEDVAWETRVQARAAVYALTPERLYEVAAERWALRWSEQWGRCSHEGNRDATDPIGVTVAEIRWADSGELEGGLGAIMRHMMAAFHPNVEQPPLSPEGWYWNFARRGNWSGWRPTSGPAAGEVECQAAIIAEAIADPEFVALVKYQLAQEELTCCEVDGGAGVATLHG